MIRCRITMIILALTALALVSTVGLAQPSPRGYVEMAYDSESDLIVLFGGATGHVADDRDPVSGETWVLHPSTGVWEQRFPDPAPPALFAANLTYDSQSDRVILWSGDSAYGDRQAALWSYDANNDAWRSHTLESDQFPQARYGARMAYHPGIDRSILFGGVIGPPNEFLNDTWALDLDTARWEKVEPANSPNARNDHHMAFDSISQSVLLWAGDVRPDIVDESVWHYDAQRNMWIEHEVGGPSPQARALGGLVGLPGVGLLAYSGREEAGSETWIYDSRANTWQVIDKEGPGARFAFALVSAGEHGVFLFGGDELPKRFEFFGDTWQFVLEAMSWEQLP